MSIPYNITTSFATKDGLPNNDPDKVIKGAEFTTEFTAIQTAFNLAAPAASPTFTGTATFADVNATGTVTVGTELDATLVTAFGAAVGSNGLSVVGDTTLTGDLAVDTNTLFVDASENAIGVGTTSNLTGLINLPEADYGEGINFYSSSVATNRFGIGKQPFESTVYWGSSDSLVFTNGGISGTERMRINASGSVGVGTSSNLNTLLTVGTATDGFSANVSGAVSQARLGSHDNSAACGLFEYDRATGQLSYAEGTFGSEGSKLVTVNNSGFVSLADGLSVTSQISSNTAGTSTIGFTFGGQSTKTGMGCPADGTLAFYAGTTTERMRISSGGNVGIGTDNPMAQLSLYAPTSAGKPTYSENRQACLNFYQDSTDGFNRFLDIAACGDASLSGANSKIRFLTEDIGDTSAVERMRINSNGDVQIQTGSISIPNNEQINFNSFADTNNTIGSNGGTGYMEYQGFNGHIFSSTAVGGEAMRIGSSGRVDIGAPINPVGKLAVESQFSVSPSSGQTTSTFNMYAAASASNGFTFTNSNGVLSIESANGSFSHIIDSDGVAGYHAFETNFSEKARIDFSGNLLVGYTSSNGAFKLQVNSQIFATNATIATSDGRYKENVQPLGDVGSVIDSLEPVCFDWKQGTEHNFLEARDVGFIAQDVETALAGEEYADAVVAKGEMYGMAYEKLVPMLVKEIQELRKRVASLENGA